MKVHLMAFVVGLMAAIANADVRDVLNNRHGNFAGQPFTKQIQPPQQQQAQISPNAGNNNNKRFWWAETQSSPFSKRSDTSNTHNHQQQHQQKHVQTQNTLHNTPQTSQQNYQQQVYTKRHDQFAHNPFMQIALARQLQQQQLPFQQQSNIYAQMASLSGSPSEVNNLMTDANFARYRPASPKIPCYGASQVCAPKGACRNGFISESDLGLVQSQANNCDSEVEECCNIQTNEQQEQENYDESTPCIEANSACVSPKHCFNGYIDQSAEHKAIQSASGSCQPSEVCCRFSDGKSANLLDNDFAAAAQSTSEVLTKEGYVVNVPSNQYLPSRPETEFNQDASNVDGSVLRPTTQGPKCSNGAPDRSYPDCCTNGGSGPYCCTNGVTNNPYCCANGAQNPSCTFNDEQPQTPKPYQPQPAPQPQSTQRPYQPAPQPQPQPTKKPYQPQPATQPIPTQRPYQPQPAPQPVPTQKPYQPAPTQKPYQPQPSPQPRPTQRPYQPNPNINVQDEAVFIPVACAAAMNCTPVEYCDANGRISKQQQDINNPMRVPMTDCLIRESGQQGKCCIDPDYTDPWPVGRTGQYVADELNAVFDDGSYRPNKRQVAANSNQVITRVAPPRRNIARRQNSIPQLQQVASENRNFASVITAAPQQHQQIAPLNEGKCGLRNLGTQPRGKAPLGTGFGEFTWVAMVILESKKALLCGGAIIAKNLVVTSANCVHGHRHNDVLIKAGEWRLGSDEEPKPFQIVRVQRILFHPQYQPKTLQNDIALLYLENDIKYDDTHIQPICLDESETEPAPGDECFTTGWGKEVLKVHLGNALMQHVKVTLLPQADCQSRLESSKLGQSNSVVCGVTQYDACQVDNGSALACTDRSGRYVLKGVYSTETDCENPNQIVAFTRTDLRWIREVLRNPSHAARS